jgi:hypothetical protein
MLKRRLLAHLSVAPASVPVLFPARWLLPNELFGLKFLHFTSGQLS